VGSPVGGAREELVGGIACIGGRRRRRHRCRRLDRQGQRDGDRRIAGARPPGRDRAAGAIVAASKAAMIARTAKFVQDGLRAATASAAGGTRLLNPCARRGECFLSHGAIIGDRRRLVSASAAALTVAKPACYR